MGDEGGFAPNISSNEEGLVLITDTIEKCGFSGKVQIGMDVASSEFYCEVRAYIPCTVPTTSLQAGVAEACMATRFTPLPSCLPAFPASPTCSTTRSHAS